MAKFHVRINGGVEQTIEINSGIYQLAVKAALCKLSYEVYADAIEVVEIWVPEVLPEYGPYWYVREANSIIPVSEKLLKEKLPRFAGN